MMNLNLETSEFHLLRNLIEKECGIALGDEKEYLVQNRLARIVAESGCVSYAQFYEKAVVDRQLRYKIVDAMTTNETLWFRDNSPFATLKELILPELTANRSLFDKPIRIWSAACSTGQEPYSIKMTLLDYIQETGGLKLKEDGAAILGTDISNSALMLAKMGRYNDLAMSRGMTDSHKAKYFTEQGRVCVVNDNVRKNIEFQQLNLQDTFDHLGQFEVVFLRNVAIYFSMDFKRNLFARIARVLKPGGFLILGSAETLTGVSDDYELKQHGRGILYRVRNRTGR